MEAVSSGDVELIPVTHTHTLLMKLSVAADDKTFFSRDRKGVFFSSRVGNTMKQKLPVKLRLRRCRVSERRKRRGREGGRERSLLVRRRPSAGSNGSLQQQQQPPDVLLEETSLRVEAPSRGRAHPEDVT